MGFGTRAAVDRNSRNPRPARSTRRINEAGYIASITPAWTVRHHGPLTLLVQLPFVLLRSRAGQVAPQLPGDADTHARSTVDFPVGRLDDFLTACNVLSWIPHPGFNKDAGRMP
jgi:hypothetical protein